MNNQVNAAILLKDMTGKSIRMKVFIKTLHRQK